LTQDFMCRSIHSREAIFEAPPLAAARRDLEIQAVAVEHPHGSGGGLGVSREGNPDCAEDRALLARDHIDCPSENAPPPADPPASEAPREQTRAQAAEAVRQYAQAQADAQMMAAVQTCIALAYERQTALVTSTNASVRNRASGQQAVRNLAGFSFESACQQNPNWYLTIPLPPPVQQRSHCDRDGMGGYDCTSE
jgi:hypothetical protein